MNNAAVLEPMTMEQFLALPDDGVDRDLVRGKLLELPLSYRGKRHTRTTAQLTFLLRRWLLTLPVPRGDLLVGDQAFRFRHDPDSIIGTGIAVISPELAARLPEDAFIIEGVPLMAVEILSPSDIRERIANKILEYLSANVPFVWIVDPVSRTVMVYRPDAKPAMFNEDHELPGEHQLPGLRISVAEIFQT